MATIKNKIVFLRELLALKEVIDTGQIHAAAERNGIKHSNMSKLISDLESRYKARLLMRSSSGCVPTNTTRQLYADIEHIVEALDNLMHNIAGPDELTGDVSVWTEEGFAGSLLFIELWKLYAKYPKIRLDILTNRHVNSSNPDIAIMSMRTANKIPGTSMLFKFKTKVKFYSTPAYLEKHGMPKDMEDMLENYDLCMRQGFLELPECKFILKRAKKLNTTADSASIIYQLVCDGAGIALMPEWCTMKNTKLIEVPNIDFDYEYVLVGISNPLTMKSPKIRAFLDFFYEFCHEYEIPLEIFE